MNLKLTYTDYLETGIFGLLEPLDESFTLFVLTHAYPETISSEMATSYVPKIPVGTYKCIRGMHKLDGMHYSFETFEVTDVPGHTGILFHSGNWNSDSNGCILLGLEKAGQQGILHSRIAFDKFMEKQLGVNEFTLEVT